MTLNDKAAQVRLLLFDVDGVLTDGTVYMHEDGGESKQFSIRDGTAVVLAHRAGLLTGILSGRPSGATARRAAQLAMAIVEQGTQEKLVVYERLLADHRLRDAEVAYMGDDLLDLPVLRRVGLSACPADAVQEVRDAVDWVSQSAGGRGAARELIELVLRARGAWPALVSPFLEPPR
jgi:3-deoxy-D-manno-octulosonate 8-phosphate phosphatase (KDO 8-P phosphatase)